MTCDGQNIGFLVILQNMWDLTPHTDLLAELPAEYTFETALADLLVSYLKHVVEDSDFFYCFYAMMFL